MSANPEAAVIAAIDALERDEVDELVDWQMSDSPAAHVQNAGNPLWSISEGSWTITDDERRIIAGFDERARERLNEMERERVAAQFAPGGASGRASDLFAITPDGERIEPDADGVLRCQPEDRVVMLVPGGNAGAAVALADRRGSGGGIDAVMAAALNWQARTVCVEAPQVLYYRAYGRTGVVHSPFRAEGRGESLGPVRGPVDDSVCDENVT